MRFCFFLFIITFHCVSEVNPTLSPPSQLDKQCFAAEKREAARTVEVSSPSRREWRRIGSTVHHGLVHSMSRIYSPISGSKMLLIFHFPPAGFQRSKQTLAMGPATALRLPRPHSNIYKGVRYERSAGSARGARAATIRG